MLRRKFIQNTALAGGALLLSPELTLQAKAARKKPKSVIVLGAGLAGLSAAYTLKKMGITVTVLESQKRVGGRVFSMPLKDNSSQIIELGAEWVGDSHAHIKSLCNEFNLKLFDNRFETHLLYEGQFSKPHEWGFSQKFEEFWSKKETLWAEYSDAKKRKLDKMDWWRFLSNQGFDQRDIMLRELMDSTDFGESIRHTSAYAAFAEYAESSEKNEMDLKIEGGNSQLVTKLFEFIGTENILLNHRVISIEQHNHKAVEIQCENGQKFTSDYLICAAPTLALKKIKWTPELPKAYDDALNSLQYARIGKFPIVFSERFWKEENFDLLTDTPAHYFYHGTKNQIGTQGVLICYAIGEKADVLGSVNPVQREEIIFDALYPAFGNVRTLKKEMLKYYWGADPSTFGAYAFYGKSQWFEVMPILKQPHVYTHFAGEHLADWQGFMEGAIQSGFDAVGQILD